MEIAVLLLIVIICLQVMKNRDLREEVDLLKMNVWSHHVRLHWIDGGRPEHVAMFERIPDSRPDAPCGEIENLRGRIDALENSWVGSDDT